MSWMWLCNRGLVLDLFVCLPLVWQIWLFYFSFWLNFFDLMYSIRFILSHPDPSWSILIHLDPSWSFSSDPFFLIFIDCSVDWLCNFFISFLSDSLTRSSNYPMRLWWFKAFVSFNPWSFESFDCSWLIPSHSSSCDDPWSFTVSLITTLIPSLFIVWLTIATH